MLYVRGNVIQTLDVSAVSVQDGLESAPSIQFANAATSGMYMPGGGAIGIAVGGIERLRISSSGISTTANVTAPYFFGNGAFLTGLTAVSVANVQITDSSWAPLAATALSNTGGYCVVNGSGFMGTVNALLGASVVPSALTVASSTQLRLALPAMDNGTYPLWVFTNQYSYAKPAALTVSPLPIWSTSTTLANVAKYTEFSQSLVATEPLSSNITYTLASGSSLPPAVSLTSGGVLSGNILEDPGNSTTYSFVIEASDLEYQKIPRTFGLTARRAFTATGGTVTYAGGYTIHTFTTSGTFAVTSNPAAATVDVLVVGGGGAGGQNRAGGGGGGRVVYYLSYALAQTSYAVTIGNGGVGYDGQSSSLIGGSVSLTAAGGIWGVDLTGSNAAAASGKNIDGVVTSYAGGSGNGIGGSGSGGRGGGGAGSGANGGNAGALGGTGGNGVQINGTYYGGGGGGGADGTAGTLPGGGAGGLGGGGTGGSGATWAVAGTPNTGGGGGGGGGSTGIVSGTPGNGGSGVVVIRYIT